MNTHNVKDHSDDTGILPRKEVHSKTIVEHDNVLAKAQELQKKQATPGAKLQKVEAKSATV